MILRLTAQRNPHGIAVTAYTSPTYHFSNQENHNMSCKICTIAAASLTIAATAAFTMGLAPSHAQTAPTKAPTTAPAAKPSPAAAPQATPAAAVQNFTIDQTHSRALFRVHHVGASQFWGRFNDVSGTFSYQPDSADGMKFDVTIKTDSVDTGAKKLDDHLRSPDFFAAKDFPEMKFASTSARKVGANMYDVTGTLTIRGVSKPLTAKLEFTGAASMGGGAKAGFEATFTIKRSEFGVNYGVENGALGDDVRVVVCLEGNAQK